MEVHSCKFIPWTPSPACAITRQVVSSSKDTLPKIAVARENGDIELWCYEKTIWIRERVFPGTSANRTRSIVWVDNLILISGLHGDIVKLDLGDPTQKPKVVESLPPVWMMSLSNNKSTIAFGCEDGSIRIFRLVDDFGSTNILFWKSLEHTDRVVSLCWDIMDKFLYSGDSRCMMKKWDVASGRVQLVFGKRSQAFVWTLVVLDAQTIACGTSWGGVQLWDTKMGTVVMEFRPGRKIPNADILAMVADVEGRTLYASGCNPTLAIIRETKQRWHLETTEPTMNWRKEFGQTEGAYLPTLPVPFDVRGMVYVANNLVWISAGGVINSMPCEKLDSSVQRPKSVAVGGIVPENRIISVSKTHGLVLSHEASTLQLWRLGKAKENFVDVQHLETGAILDLAQDHSQVLQLSLKSKNVTSSSLSEDGRFIAACDAFSLKLFEISMQTTGHPIVNKVKVPAIAAVTCAFSHDSTKVFVGGIDSTTYILQITQQSKQLVATVEQQFRPDASEKLPVQHLSLNHDGTLLVSADSHNISIYDIKAAKCETLPRFEETISVLKFWNSQVEHKETGLQSLLFIVTSVNKIFTFNTETKNLAEWPLHGTLGQLHYATRIRSMTFNPSKPQLVLVSMKHLHFITVENQLPVKYSRVLSNSPLYGEFLYDVEFIGQNQLAIFGRTLTQLLEKLPPVLAFRKFAT